MEKGGVEKGSWGGGRAPLHYLRTFRRKSKSILRTLLNSPSLCDVQAPALKRHAGPRPFSSGHHGLGDWGGAADTATTTYPAEIRRDKEPMDDDMARGGNQADSSPHDLDPS